MGAILNDNTKLITLKSGKLRKISNQGVSGSIGLARTAAMWPTPRTTGLDGGSNSRKAAKEQVMWPTPCASDHKGAGKTGQLRDRLDYATERGGTKTKSYPVPPEYGGQLNPTWVEWLIGWPLGWTDCAASATDKFQQWCALHGEPCQLMPENFTHNI
jgi:DNA (cytosine-5)-methyltransferase 1